MTSVTKTGITISIENNIQVIRFNNPSQKNSIQRDGFSVITRALEDASQNPDVLLTVLTGTGDYFSSGLDITRVSTFLEKSERESPANQMMDAKNDFSQMMDAFIYYPKLLVAIVNGPAIGAAVAVLGLCDIVYATENATFTTPFSKLGLCAEGCASYTFPQILGRSKANEMLLVGHKMTAEEALQFKFISRIFKQSEIHKIWELVSEFKNGSQQSIQVTKKLSKSFEREALKRANETEIKNIKMLFKTDDFKIAVTAFTNRKSKL